MEKPNLHLKLIGTLSLIAIMLSIAIYFMYHDIKSKNESILQVENNLSFKNTEYDYLVSMQNFIMESESEIAKINSSIISKDGEVAFIENLESRARSYNLKIEIDSLNLASNDTKTASSTVSTLKIKASAEGSWANIYKFISEVESLPERIKINKISLSYRGDLLDQTIPEQNKIWGASFEVSVLKYQ